MAVAVSRPTKQSLSNLPLTPYIEYPKWMGGSASCMAVVFSHPLDLLKVRMQTLPASHRPSIFGLMRDVLAADGIRGLYGGLSAGLLRQFTYGTTRFAIYESIKDQAASRNSTPSLLMLIPAAAASGFVGAMVGNPADIANVRMQSDAGLPRDLRRNYRNVFDALAKIYQAEGFQGFLRGIFPNCIRGGLMTSCQLASYDGFKSFLMGRLKLEDGTATQLMSSVLASLVATTICSPVDVVKTCLMNSSQGITVLHLVRELTRNEGARWVFRGWLPSFARLGPHTIATLLFLEQHKKIYVLVKGE